MTTSTNIRIADKSEQVRMEDSMTTSPHQFVMGATQYSPNSTLKKGKSVAVFLFVSSVVFLGVIVNGWQANIASALGIHRPVSMLEHAGGVQLSAVNLKGHVPLAMHMGHARYWLGPISGFSDTTNCATPGVLKVGYFEPGQQVNMMSQAKIMIAAFETEAIYNSTSHPLQIDSETQLVNARGDLLSYHKSNMNSFMIRQQHSDEIITITYANPKSLSTMVSHSEMLSAL